MTTVGVKMPSLMQRALGAEEEVPANGNTVGQVIQDMEQHYPGFRDRVLDENGKRRPFVLFVLNNDDIRYLKELDTPTQEGDVLTIMTVASGG